ncbi:MAG: hypothetical protein VB015_02275 [Erysipelotrichaceae bacterium]|nr:hypothetical protein [Erysipelotrichaceae bacterium]
MDRSKISILIFGYDPYSDAIDFFPYFFEKYWSNCPYETYFVSSEAKINSTKITTLNTHGDLSYSGRLKLALSNIKTEYVLVLEEDYLLSGKINTNRIEEVVDFLKQHDEDYCQVFSPFRSNKGKKVGSKILLRDKDVKYKVNLQPSIFSVRLLQEIAKNDVINPWEAEMYFIKNCKEMHSYFAYDRFFKINNYIFKGKADRKTVKCLKKEKLWKNQRQVMSVKENLALQINYKLISILPSFIKKLMRNRMKKSGKTFISD